MLQCRHGGESAVPHSPGRVRGTAGEQGKSCVWTPSEAEDKLGASAQQNPYAIKSEHLV